MHVTVEKSHSSEEKGASWRVLVETVKNVNLNLKGFSAFDHPKKKTKLLNNNHIFDLISMFMWCVYVPQHAQWNKQICL